AVEWCISQGYLIDYLRKKRMEAKQMIMLDIDEEAYMEALKEDAREEGLAQGITQGIAQGIEQGISQGKEHLLVEQICKKIRKGKTAEQISEELEEDVSRVAFVYKIASKYAPDFDSEKVIEALNKK
ncbi:MAG: hypothetical protein K6G57_03750, partial [Lachnospiraceae bacterium]|nr:hypothetical protein [Lachnospiraceae bacterium]